MSRLRARPDSRLLSFNINVFFCFLMGALLWTLKNLTSLTSQR